MAAKITKKIVKKKAVKKKAIKKKTVTQPKTTRPEGKSSKYTELEIRNCIYAAIKLGRPGKPAYEDASRVTGVSRQQIPAYFKKYPEWVEDEKAKIGEQVEKDHDRFADEFSEAIMKGLRITSKMLDRCINEKGELILEKRYDSKGNYLGVKTVETLRDVVGMTHMFFDKRQLAIGKPTDNIGGSVNFIFGTKNLKPIIPSSNNRLKGMMN